MAKQKEEIDDVIVEDTDVGLEDFSWDSDKSFFGVEPVAKDELPVDDDDDKKKKTEDVDDDIEEPTPKPKAKEKVLPEEDEDEVVEDDDDKKKKKEAEPFSDITEEPEEEPERDDKFFTVLASELKDAGVFANVEIKEDENIDEEKFIALQDNEIESRVNETFEAFFEELDDDGKAFLKFKKSGGNTADFFKSARQSSEIPKGDMDDKNFQKKFLKYYYETFESMDAEDADERVDYLEDAGRLGKYAERYHDKVDEAQKKRKEEMVKQAEIAEKQRDSNREEYQKNLRTKLDDVEAIKDFPITPKDKKDLFSYITKPVKKVGKNTYISQFQDDMNKVGSDFDTLILLAKLVKSDFDVSDIEKKVETKKTRNIKDKLQGQRRTKRPRSGGKAGGKTLSDFF